MGSTAIVILAYCSNSELVAKVKGKMRTGSIKYIFFKSRVSEALGYTRAWVAERSYQKANLSLSARMDSDIEMSRASVL